MQVVDARAKLDAAARRFTSGSEGRLDDPGRSPEEDSSEKEESPVETPEWRDLRRNDVQAMLRARQKELDQLLCRYFVDAWKHRTNGNGIGLANHGGGWPVSGSIDAEESAEGQGQVGRLQSGTGGRRQSIDSRRTIRTSTDFNGDESGHRAERVGCHMAPALRRL